MSGNRYDFPLSDDDGVNNIEHNQNFDGRQTLWAGWETEPKRAHRYIFAALPTPSRQIEEEYDHTTNWCNAVLNFKVSHIDDGDNVLQILGSNVPGYTEGNITWDTMFPETEYNSARNRTVVRPGSGEEWYKLYIPPDLWTRIRYNDPYKGIFLRETSNGGFVHIYSRHEPDTLKRPWIRAYYMRYPNSLSTETLKTSNIKATWGKYDPYGIFIENDDFFSKYYLSYDYWKYEGGSLVKATKTYSVLGASSGNNRIYNLDLPNGVYGELKVHGLYYSSNAGERVSKGYKSENVSVAYPPKDFTINTNTPGLAKLSWSAPSNNGGYGPVNYIVLRKPPGGTYSIIAVLPSSTTSYDDTKAAGSVVYQVRARYSIYHPHPVFREKIILKSIVYGYSEEKTAYVNWKPVLSISSPAENGIVNDVGGKITISGTSSSPDGDTLSQITANVKIFSNNVWKSYTRDGYSSSGEKTYPVSGNSWSFALGGLSKGEKIKVRVKGKDTNNLWGDYTEWREIRINDNPKTTLISPVGDIDSPFYTNSLETIEVKFSDTWSDEKAVAVNLKIYPCDQTIETHVDENISVNIENGKTKTISVSSYWETLDPRTFYYIQVRTKDDHGLWSSLTEKQYICYYLEADGEFSYTYLPPNITNVSPTRAEQRGKVEIDGSYFGTIQGNTKLFLQNYEISNAIWGDTHIEFYAPLSIEDVEADKYNSDNPNPLLCSEGYTDSKVHIKLMNEDGSITYGGKPVEKSFPLSLYAELPEIESHSPQFTVGTNQLLRLVGKNFGNFWQYNLHPKWKVRKEGQYLIGDTKAERSVKITVINISEGITGEVKEADAVIATDIGGGWTRAENFRNDETLDAISESCQIYCVIPEDATEQMEIYVSSPWSKSPHKSESIFLALGRPEFDPLMTDPETGDKIKPVLYWEQDNVLTGKYFGDYQNSSKLAISVNGKNIELKNNLIWSNESISFFFGGFTWPGRTGRPQGEKATVALYKYFSDGTLRHTASIPVECWGSPSERHVFLESKGTGKRNRGYGEDESTYALTIPPGCPGVAQKSLRLVNGDISLLPSGRLEFISRRPKILQDILIAILTPRGNDVYHPTYGCSFDFRVGDTYNAEWFASNIKSEITRILQNYVEAQKAQAEFKHSIAVGKGTDFIWDVEQIVGIKGVDVTFDEDKIFIRISLITTEGYLEIKRTIAI